MSNLEPATGDFDLTMTHACWMCGCPAVVWTPDHRWWCNKCGPLEVALRVQENGGFELYISERHLTHE